MCGMQRSWEETVKDFLGGELSQLLPVQLACMPCFQTGSWEAAVAKSLDVRRCYQSSCSRWDRGGTSLVQLVSALPAWVPPPALSSALASCTENSNSHAPPLTAGPFMKSTQQGAATSVYAATAGDWRGSGSGAGWGGTGSWAGRWAAATRQHPGWQAGAPRHCWQDLH